MPPFTVALIGAGAIARVHADAWRSLDSRVLVYSFEGSEALAAEYGFEVAATLEEALATAEIADIVTPTASHAAIALAAIAAGVHVICEKPLAPTAAEAQEIADAAATAGVRLFPAHVVRYFPEYRAIKEQVAAGHIGRLATQRFFRMGARPDSAWFFREEDGGGVIRDLMIHDIDQAVWLAGAVTSVYAVQSPAEFDATAPVAVTAHLVLTHENGALTHLQSSWGAAGMPFRTSIEVSGSSGRLAHASSGDTSALVDTGIAADGGYLPPTSAADSPYTLEIVDFVTAIGTGLDAAVTPRDGVAAVTITDAAYASLTSGQTIHLSEVSR